MNEELQNLKKEFEQRIKVLEEKSSEPDYGFEKGDDFWFIGGDGKPQASEWGDLPTFEKTLFSMGGVFKSGEEALFEIERRKVLHELRMMGRPFKRSEKNWRFQLDGRNDLEFEYDSFYRVPYVDCYFDTQNEAKEAVAQIGESRIKKYLFGLEEH